jgi:hypothetical protein
VSGSQVGGAVDVDDGAGDVLGARGGQEDDRPGDFLGRRRPVEGTLGADGVAGGAFQEGAAMSVSTKPGATVVT